MRRSWQLQEAKNHLSEVVDLALSQGPQTVTRHGKEVVVIVDKQEFERRRSGRKRGTIAGFLRGLRFKGARIDIARATDRDRPLDL
jgi:prevent-host-death family protein